MQFTRCKQLYSSSNQINALIHNRGVGSMGFNLKSGESTYIRESKIGLIKHDLTELEYFQDILYLESYFLDLKIFSIIKTLENILSQELFHTLS